MLPEADILAPFQKREVFLRVKEPSEMSYSGDALTLVIFPIPLISTDCEEMSALTFILLIFFTAGCDVDNRLKKVGSNIGTFGSTTAKKVGRSVQTGVKNTQRVANKFVQWVKEKASPEQKRVAKKKGAGFMLRPSSLIL